MSEATIYQKVLIPRPDHVSVSERLPLSLHLARFWNRYVPRGKGWFPRLVGRTLAKGIKCSIRTKLGAHLVVEPTSLDVYVHILNQGGIMEERIFDVCASLIERGNVFYDIGANVGLLSVEMAKKFDDQITIVSFEPQSDLANAIAASAVLNEFDNIRVLDMLVGENEGEQELYLTSHSLHASVIPREQKARKVTKLMGTLDRLVASGAVPPPNVIKIDVEGSELAAFHGAQEVLTTYRPHVVFEADENMRRFGVSANDLILFLKECCEYEFFFIAEGARLIPVTDIADQSTMYRDILARSVAAIRV